MFVSDGASLGVSEATEAEDLEEEALAKLSLTQVTREGDEDTVRRLLELYSKESSNKINRLDDSKVKSDIIKPSYSVSASSTRCPRFTTRPARTAWPSWNSS